MKIRPSHQRPVTLNFSQFVGFQDPPDLSKIVKIAENRDFDGKDTLIVKRASNLKKSIGMKIRGYLYSLMALALPSQVAAYWPCSPLGTAKRLFSSSAVHHLRHRYS